MKNGFAAAIAAATAALLVTGCGENHPAQSFVPGTSSFGNFSWTFHKSIGPATALPPCSAKTYKPPGKFTVLAALGEFSGSSFSGAGLSLWGTFTATKGFNNPPNMAPNFGTKYTIYYGTFKLNSGVQGCIYVAKVTYMGVSFDGAVGAWQNVRGYGTATPSAEGPLAISLKSLSPKGGSGTLTLKDPGGKTIATGTVSIKGSKVIK